MNIKVIEPSQYLPNGALCRFPKLWVTGLTAIYLAALTPGEYNVSVCNEVLEDIDFDEEVDLVAITVMGEQVLRAIEIADAFRERGKPVVIGGYQTSLSYELVESHVDAVVFGEAENVWHQVLEDARAGRLKKRYDGTTSASITGTPVPRYDLIDLKRHSRLFPVEATRGCPNVCTFCAVPQRYHSSFRTYPIDDVLRNVEAVRSLGVRNIFFVDNNLTANVEYAKKLFAALIPLKIRWTSQASVEIANDPELLDLTGASGCMSLSIGFESINQDSLRGVGKKNARVESYRHMIRQIMKRNIHINALVVFGFDQDAEDVFLKTADFFDKAGVSLLDCFILVPVPGTPLFDQLKRKGRILTDDYRQYNVTNVVFQPLKMSPETLRKGLWESLRQFYRISAIIRRMGRNMMGKPLVWGAISALNYFYRQAVYNHENRVPTIWHAPNS
jgi:radical SAM superfamily enzyme YgiQ (UPF0313 family)